MSFEQMFLFLIKLFLGEMFQDPFYHLGRKKAQIPNIKPPRAIHRLVWLPEEAQLGLDGNSKTVRKLAIFLLLLPEERRGYE